MNDRVVDGRKQRGAWYTPSTLIDPMMTWLAASMGRPDDRACAAPLRVVDPACGDGRLLVAVRRALEAHGRAVELHGADVDADAIEAARAAGVDAVHTDALAHSWPYGTFDIVVGNPPFLSQMAASTSRGGTSAHGGGPYADAAVEFVALAHRLVRPDGGRIGLVLPQSVLGVRDAASVRASVDRGALLDWWWWEPAQREFDASVNVCVLGWRTPGPNSTPWTSVVTDRLGMPTLDVDRLDIDGTVGDRNGLNANFRDEYYALVPAVSDETVGPPLVTSGLIDPAQCWWGQRSVRFAKRRFDSPRVDLDRLTGRFSAWAARKLVPKVLIANQTSVVEAVADHRGDWLPGVPVTTATPLEPSARLVAETAAVLTSPVATAFVWQLGAGTGLSTRSVRVGPRQLAAVPWPRGPLDAAVEALHDGAPLVDIAAAVMAAYDCGDDTLFNWWVERLPAASPNR